MGSSQSRRKEHGKSHLSGASERERLRRRATYWAEGAEGVENSFVVITRRCCGREREEKESTSPSARSLVGCWIVFRCGTRRVYTRNLGNIIGMDSVLKIRMRNRIRTFQCSPGLFMCKCVCNISRREAPTGRNNHRNGGTRKDGRGGRGGRGRRGAMSVPCVEQSRTNLAIHGECGRDREGAK